MGLRKALSCSKNTKLHLTKTRPTKRNPRFPRVRHIRLDKGPEGCNDTTDLAALQACPRTTASLTDEGKRTSSHGGSSRGGGTGGAGKRRKVAGRGRGGGAGGGRQVSELFATDRGDAVSVEQRVFVTQNTTLEMCVIGTGFSKVSMQDTALCFEPIPLCLYSAVCHYSAVEVVVLCSTMM